MRQVFKGPGWRPWVVALMIICATALVVAPSAFTVGGTSKTNATLTASDTGAASVTGAVVHQRTGRLVPATRPAPFGVTYDQENNWNAGAVTSQDFETANDALDSETADDFTLGAAATIRDVEVEGAYSSSATL